MKKLVIVLGLLAALGRQEAQRTLQAPQTLPKRAHLLPTAAPWKDAYGDDDQTNLYSNVWALIMLTQDTRTRLKTLEEKAIMDGDEIEIDGCCVFFDDPRPVIRKVDPNDPNERTK